MLLLFSVKEEFLMGRGKQEQPQRIAEKLRQIRLSLGLTQDEMAKRLESQNVKVYRGYVGLFMAYARIAGVPMETLCDDKLELPATLKAKR
jgi:transcriptional regulator with XRE-family HTH domain